MQRSSIKFESSVNPEGIQTTLLKKHGYSQFESSVNPEGIQTMDKYIAQTRLFESSVNPEGIQTNLECTVAGLRLRVV